MTVLSRNLREQYEYLISFADIGESYPLIKFHEKYCVYAVL